MLLHGKHLFPLNKIICLNGGEFNGYYMDGSGTIWSTRSGRLKHMGGSQNAFTGHRISFQMSNGKSKTFRLEDIRKSAKAHADFLTETKNQVSLASALGLRPASLPSIAVSPIWPGKPSGNSVAKPYVPASAPEPALKPIPPEKLFYQRNFKSTLSAKENCAASFSDGIKRHGWVIALAKDDTLVLCAPTVIHLTPESIDAALTRFANAAPGCKFVKLRIEKALTVGVPVWE